jgi:hypothetical protein
MPDIVGHTDRRRRLFGYRLVPKDLYDLMLAALEARPVSSSVGTIDPDVGRASAPATETPTAQNPTLPEAVVNACEQFGFGDREEIGRNYRRAWELQAQGRDPRRIVEEIRRGADVTGLFV